MELGKFQNSGLLGTSSESLKKQNKKQKTNKQTNKKKKNAKDKKQKKKTYFYISGTEKQRVKNFPAFI